MPQNRLWIREETRVLGAIQVMNGLLLHSLGLLWVYLLVTQISAFGKSYVPVAVITRYPFWSAFIYILSGVSTIFLEKRRTRFLVTYSIALNIVSACTSVIGLMLLAVEFVLFSLMNKPIWPHRAGKILSNYLFFFTILELFVTCIVVNWSYKAKHRR